MKLRIFIIGVGMTRILKEAGSYESLCEEAIREAMADAGLSFDGDKGAIGGIFYGNCAQGMLTSQHCIRGQVILRRLGFARAPVVNVENACATASVALNQAIHHVRAGVSHLALAVGVEKMMPDFSNLKAHPEIEAALPYMGLAAFWMGCEQDRKDRYVEHWRRQKSELLGIPIEQTDVGVGRSPFMDYYAVKALQAMKQYGYTQAQMAQVCAKTHHHSTMNPKAQYQEGFHRRRGPDGQGHHLSADPAHVRSHRRRMRRGHRLFGALSEGASGGEGSPSDPRLGTDFRSGPGGFRPGYLRSRRRNRFPAKQPETRGHRCSGTSRCNELCRNLSDGAGRVLQNGAGRTVLLLGCNCPGGRTSHEYQRWTDLAGAPRWMYGFGPDL